MPQEPKKRHSRQRKGKRRASISYSTQKGMLCQNCANVVLPHRVCKHCGYYGGKKVLAVKEKVAPTA